MNPGKPHDGERSVTQPVAGFLVALLAMLHGVLVLRTAWLSDDAYITFRAVENFLAGYGPVWNAGERVQVFTHPLWFFCVSGVARCTGEIYYAAMSLSLAAGLGATAVAVWGCARDTWSRVVLLALLSLSKAYVEYTTSGLENPLTNLLLALFVCRFLRAADAQPGESPAPRAGTLFTLALLGGLLAFNRMDTVLFVVPALAWLLSRRSSLGRLALVAAGFLPLIAWMAFSTWYYGFPFPNTAYAKLGSGIPVSEFMIQGFYYLLNSLSWDPWTLIAIALALGFALRHANRDPATHMLLAGVVLALAWLVRAGGDFMSGRFLAAPYFVAAIVLAVRARAAFSPAWAWRTALVAAPLAIALQAPYHPIHTDALYPRDLKVYDVRTKISDERGKMYPHTGLLLDARADRQPRHDWVQLGASTRSRGPRVVQGGAIGFFGFSAGPGVHIIDEIALGDAFLAHLPAIPNADWEHSHFRRVIPEGYLETIESGTNQLRDPALHAYFDKLAAATRAPLDSPFRLREILKLNLGTYALYTAPEPQPPRREPAVVWLPDLFAWKDTMAEEPEHGPPAPQHGDEPTSASGIAASQSPYGPSPIRQFHPRPGAVAFGREGLIVRVAPDRVKAQTIELLLEADDDIAMEFREGRRALGRVRVDHDPPSTPGGERSSRLVRRRVEVPPTAASHGWDRVFLRPVGGDGRCSVARLELDPKPLYRLSDLLREQRDAERADEFERILFDGRTLREIEAEKAAAEAAGQADDDEEPRPEPHTPEP